MTQRTIKSYTRGIPDPLQSEIDRTLASKIAKAKADATVNMFREKIGYAPGTPVLDIVIGALRFLSVKAKELVQ